MFVTIEGTDGAGKTTLAAGLVERLTARGVDVVSVREPGGTALGESLRRILLDPGARIGAPAEALLYAAARAELVSEVIGPALGAGRLLICDRFVESSLAYQGAGRGLGVEAVRAVNRLATGGLEADVVLLLDLPPEAARRRRNAVPDRMEAEDAGFSARVRRCFLDLAAAEPDRFVVIDATAAPDGVLTRALEAVEGRM